MIRYEYTKNKKKSRGDEPILHYCKEDTDIPAGATCGPVIRDIYVIECHTEGYGTIKINDNEFKLKPGCCYATFPGQVTVLTSDAEYPRRGFFCILSGSRVGEILQGAGITEKSPFAPPEAFEIVVEIIKKLIDMKNEVGVGAELRRTAYIYEMLSAFMIGKSTSDKDMWIERALVLFETGYQDDINVSDIAAGVGFDRSYFSMLFKEYTGVSPHKYLTTVRIEKACKLLCETNTPIAEISESVGIEPSNFARIFKAEMGMSPMQYKKKHGKK